MKRNICLISLLFFPLLTSFIVYVEAFTFQDYNALLYPPFKISEDTNNTCYHTWWTEDWEFNYYKIIKHHQNDSVNIWLSNYGNESIFSVFLLEYPGDGDVLNICYCHRERNGVIGSMTYELGGDRTYEIMLYNGDYYPDYCTIWFEGNDIEVYFYWHQDPSQYDSYFFRTFILIPLIGIIAAIVGIGLFIFFKLRS